jgi:hypothetical protein
VTWKPTKIQPKEQTPLVGANGRPFVIAGHRSVKHPNPKWGWIHYNRVQYLDGQQPATEELTRGTVKQAKKVRAGEALIWHRVADLAAEGMEPQRAKEQATAELAKGILAEKAF